MADEMELEVARLRAERDVARQDLDRARRYSDGLDRECEELRDLLNGVAWGLGLGREVHYLSEDDYEACQRAVLDAIGELARLKDRSRDTTVSAYDLLPEEDREALRWVREHGGLESLKSSLSALELFAEGIEIDTGRAFYDESMAERCVALRNEVKMRLMPEGYEWPRYESGELVRFGEPFVDGCGNVHVLHEVDIRDDKAAGIGSNIVLKASTTSEYDSVAYNVWKHERIKRPQALAADGEPLEVGQTVYFTCGDGEAAMWESPIPEFGIRRGQEFTVKDLDGRIAHVEDCDGVEHGISSNNLTHQRPVLDADGVPIHEGDEVYLKYGVSPYRVAHLPEGEQERVAIESDGTVWYYAPDQLTHDKPEPSDSWDALWADIEDCSVGYEGFMRRCKALAGAVDDADR